MPNMIDTDDVAKHLGILPRSVGITLKRRGIEPLFRRPGMGGQSVYNADQVYAAWPLVTGNTDDGPTFSTRRRDTVTTVEIVVDVVGAEPVQLVHHMRPTTLKLTCRNHHDGTGWQVDATLWGPRVLKSGADGAEVTEYIGMTNRVNPDRVPPEWVGRRVAELTATLPDIR